MKALKFIKTGRPTLEGTVLKGNTLMDVEGVAIGPTSTTGWYAPPSAHNGYTIGQAGYRMGAKFWCPANDAEVIQFCNTTASPSPATPIITIDDALMFLQESGYMVTYNNTTLRSTTSLEGFPAKLPMDGLSCYLDAQIEQSSGTANRWFDISGNGLEFIKQGGTGLSLADLGGYQGFQFNDSGYFQCNDLYNSVNIGGDCTIVMWVWCTSILSRDTIFEKAGNGGASYQCSVAITWETNEGFSYYSRKTPAYDYASTVACDTNGGAGAWTMMAIKMSTGLTSTARTGFYSKNGANFAASYVSRSTTALDRGKQIRVGTGYAGPVEGPNGIGAVLTYNKMLSNAEILAVYNATASKFGML